VRSISYSNCVGYVSTGSKWMDDWSVGLCRGRILYQGSWALVCRWAWNWRAGWDLETRCIRRDISSRFIAGRRVKSRGGGAGCSLSASLKLLLSYLCIDLTLSPSIFSIFSYFQLSFLVPFPAPVFPSILRSVIKRFPFSFYSLISPSSRFLCGLH